MNSITLINPNLVTQLGDSFGSGIPYMPLSLAYMAAVLKNDYKLNVIDAFGEKPHSIRIEGKLIVQGMTIEEVLRRIDPSSSSIVIYLSTLMVDSIIKQIIVAIKNYYPLTPIIIIENSQAVIGCSLEHILDEYLDFGADYIVVGECEIRIQQLLDTMLTGELDKLKDVDGIAWKENDNHVRYIQKKNYIADLDNLPFPAWEYFPLNNYWKLGYSHGPMQGKYLAILTSRGCPFNCNFCVIPATNNRRWRSRTAENVVNEMEYMMKKFGVYEFHFEDVNPTANEKRIIEMCKIIIEKKMNVRWKLASGSKIETMKLDTLQWMKKAGCNYISISPESGSQKVLNLMNKPFNYNYAKFMVEKMKRIGITTQACFVLGYPGEEDEDIYLTELYIKELTKVGVDEIALFIMTPIPGTKTFGKIHGFKNYSELTFSPEWRDDFGKLNEIRKKLYVKFFILKMIYYPISVLMQGINLIRKNFRSKAEMNIYRVLKLYWLCKRRGVVK